MNPFRSFGVRAKNFTSKTGNEELINFSFHSVAGKPKKENALKSLAIMLGPDYITDIIEVKYPINRNF